MLVGTGVMGVLIILTYFVNPAVLWLTHTVEHHDTRLQHAVAIYFKRLSPSVQAVYLLGVHPEWQQGHSVTACRWPDRICCSG
jgi:hypothetical protein